jgi:hypothetical protein
MVRARPISGSTDAGVRRKLPDKDARRHNLGSTEDLSILDGPRGHRSGDHDPSMSISPTRPLDIGPCMSVPRVRLRETRRLPPSVGATGARLHEASTRRHRRSLSPLLYL